MHLEKFYLYFNLLAISAVLQFSVRNSVSAQSSKIKSDDVFEKVTSSTPSTKIVRDDSEEFSRPENTEKGQETSILRERRALDGAPLDIHHALDTVNGLVGILGGSSSSLVVALTGISLTDCALSFNGVDVSSLSCEDFLDILSTCDSLMHVQPLFKAAKKKLRHQHIPTNRPCSRNAVKH